MEHLVLPKGATILDPEKAPYVAVPYDSGPFLSYPERNPTGILFQRLLPDAVLHRPHHGYTSEQAREVETFLQTWLFFGLLEEVFGDLAPESKFITVDDVSILLNTSNLPDIARAWRERVKLNRPSKEEIWHLKKCIDKADSVLRMDSLHNDPQFEQIIIWTLAILASSIRELIDKVFPEQMNWLPTVGWRPYKQEEGALVFEERMMANGWCPYDAHKWQVGANDFEALIYVSKLKVPRIKDHSACNISTRCRAPLLSVKDDGFPHRCDQGKCGMIATDNEKVKYILASGHIALLEEDRSQGESFRVVSSQDHPKYVALSHVWMDGFGNPLANALPWCQMHFLMEKFREFKSTVEEPDLCLWIDTLCCPVDDIEHRNLCLAQMHTIYQGAAHVLVLDAALLLYNWDDVGLFELGARFAISTWFTRLWTFQEGALSEDLWIQLNDRVYKLDVVSIGYRMLSRDTYMHEPLLRCFGNGLDFLRGFAGRFRSGEKGIDLGLGQIIHSIGKRAVSVPTDEALCLSTALSLPLDGILEGNLEQRMLSFWQNLGKTGMSIPQNIMMFDGPRLTTPGWRWAPMSVLEPVDFYRLGNNRYTKTMATVTPFGLASISSGLRLGVAEPFAETCSIYQWEGKNIMEGHIPAYYLRQTSKDWYQLFPCGDSYDLKEGVEELVRSAGLAMITTSESMEEASERNSEPFPCGRVISEDGVNKFEYLQAFKLVVLDPVSASFFETAYHLAQSESISKLAAEMDWNTAERNPLPDHIRERALERLPSDLRNLMVGQAHMTIHNDAELKKNLSMHQSLPSTRIAELMLYAMAGWVVEITETWSSDQKWLTW